ncbi:putative nuclease HARBI1 [Bacillus rossius redtenbacheri]|uniref:putative nuclease HARBI1 n=1 Tax=Bacillus rossius redtenbacheri TaxID=93214 RepID=UPI002FDDA9C0
MAADLDELRNHINGVFEFYEELEDHVRLPKRYIRNTPDPFEIYREKEFQNKFRFSKEVVRNVLYPFVQHLEKPDNRGLPIPAERQLLLALRFYATGSFHEVCGDMSGLSRSTAGAIVKAVTEALAGQLRHHIKLPNTDEEMNGAMQKFFEIGNFPGVVAAIDCTHVPIANPGGDRGEVFRNRHGIFSLNVQVAVSAQMKIIDICATRPGSCHDARIFDGSGLKVCFEEQRIKGIMLGDSGYPCLPYLFTPLLNPQTEAEERYNVAHIRTRNIVERTFGVWKRRFRCLTKKLEHKPENIVAIICATAVLHNISLDVEAPLPEDEFPWVDVFGAPIAAEAAAGNRNRLGHLIRADFIQRRFM